MNENGRSHMELSFPFVVAKIDFRSRSQTKRNGFGFTTQRDELKRILMAGYKPMRCVGTI